MNPFSNRDLELYVMGAFEGDVQALEAFLASDEQAQAFVADEAKLELTLRQAAESATFCVACDDLVRDTRCESCGAAVHAGGYQVEKVLVENAHGRLYLATDSDGMRVALKELVFVQSPGAEALAAFEREAKFLRALSHPRIPRFVASFSEGKGVSTRLYLAQEYIDGESLDARLGAHWFAEDEILDIGEQVLEVLVYLQSLSPIVVHRDIKPANLVRREDGGIAVVDFGAALDRGQTQGSTTIGTFGYMPLEQMAGVVDSTTDLYALGASLWHLLTRQEPWKMLGSTAMEAANVSAPVDAYLRKMVASTPGERFPSSQVALSELAKVRRGEAPEKEPEKKLSRREQKRLAKAEKKAQRPKRSIAWPVAFTILGVVGIGSIAGTTIATTAIESGTEVFTHSTNEEPSPAPAAEESGEESTELDKLKLEAKRLRREARQHEIRAKHMEALAKKHNPALVERLDDPGLEGETVLESSGRKTGSLTFVGTPGLRVEVQGRVMGKTPIDERFFEAGIVEFRVEDPKTGQFPTTLRKTRIKAGMQTVIRVGPKEP